MCLGALDKETLPHFDPFPQPLHPADLGKLGRLVLKRQRRVATEQFVFRPHHLWNVRLGNDTVVVHRLGREPAGVRRS